MGVGFKMQFYHHPLCNCSLKKQLNSEIKVAKETFCDAERAEPAGALITNAAERRKSKCSLQQTLYQNKNDSSWRFYHLPQVDLSPASLPHSYPGRILQA